MTNFADNQRRHDRGELNLMECYDLGATHAGYGWAPRGLGSTGDTEQVQAYHRGHIGAPFEDDGLVLRATLETPDNRMFTACRRYFARKGPGNCHTAVDDIGNERVMVIENGKSRFIVGHTAAQRGYPHADTPLYANFVVVEN